MALLRRIGTWLRWLAAALLGTLSRRRRADREDEAGGRVVPEPPPGHRAAAIATLLLAGSALAFIAFAASYLLELGNAALGGALALGFGLAAAAALTAATRLVPQEEVTEELGSHEHGPERRESAETIREGGEGLTRRKVLVAAGCSGCAAAAALALPAASLGPVLDTERLRRTPWRVGRPLVDEGRARILADDIDVGSFVTAFPENADPKALDSPLIVARVRPDELDLPPERADWAPEGLLAYSKICTHAACAISLFDYPTYPPNQPGPRLVCPCHYSVFDATGGGEVLEGPAGRPLPQLPLRIGAERELLAGGGFSAPPGPSWSGVREP